MGDTMLGALWFLAAASCLVSVSTNPRIRDKQPLVTLPSWKQNGDYLTKCTFNDDHPLLCGWTLEAPLKMETGQGHIRLSHKDSELGDVRLMSSFLNVSSDTCVEFWFHKPGPNSTDVRMLVIDTAGKRELWNSLDSMDSTWQQALVQLAYSGEATIQVVFEAMQDAAADGYAAIDNVGVRRGLCGDPCTQGSDFWADGTCSTRCTCSRQRLSCSPSSCPEDQSCDVISGVPACRSSPAFGTCSVNSEPRYSVNSEPRYSVNSEPRYSVNSEPRYSTFDGATFPFEGSCTYILAQLCGAETVDLPYFSVEAENEQGANRSSSAIKQVNVDLYGLRVSMLHKESGRVMVNGLWKRLPLRLKGDLVRINPSTHSVTLTTDLHLAVSFDNGGTVRVRVSGAYSRKMCGLCGNFNRLRKDDYVRPDGSQAPDARALGRSWQKEGASCETAFLPQLCTPQHEAEFEGESSCGLLLARTGPFANCSALVQPEPYFRTCVLDMCSVHGDPQTLCVAFQAYADACRAAGIHLRAWRNSTLCPIICQTNSHYNPCASGCPAACSVMDTPLSCGDCEERCDCDPGFTLSGGACVSMQDCGCWDHNQHYEKGATFMARDCEMLCQCLGGGDIQCAPASCSKDEVCTFKDGALGCFSSTLATCQVFGDPHYITFDGKVFDFQGSCNYTLLTTCGNSTVRFSVTARNENRGNPAWSALNSVALAVEGIHIALRKEKLVYVNGQQAELPLESGSQIRVFLKGAYVQVETTFGLRLLFDGQHRLFLQVDERYRAEVCGLCGTYSDSQYDDFVTPGGELVAKPEEFAISWRVEDSEWECVAKPPPLPECNTQLQDDGAQKCSILFEDPFQPCHWFVPPKLFVTRCVYDHCATQGDPYQLCISLESYAATCEVQGVELGDWGWDTTCANFTLKPTIASATTPLFPTNFTLNPTTAPVKTSSFPANFTLNPTITPATASSSPVCSLNCDFDSSECGWHQLITDSFDWSRHWGPTTTDFTGPSHDHTTGDGYYMYIEADGVHHGDSARLLSPACLVAGPVCLHFWYHVYGSASAMALNMYQLHNNTATRIWSVANNHGNRWLPAKVELNIVGSFQIIAEGIRGSNPWSDVAFDDVAVQYGTCSGLSNTDLDTTSALACELCCTFDIDICGWIQLLTDSFDWTRLNGSTPTPKTGPSSDHTTGDGHYLYIEADGVHNGDTARLLSPECPESGPHCLRFWYHMYGTADTMGLSIYLLENRSAQKVWALRNNQGNTWHAAEVELTASGAFQIIFEGRRGTDEHSDVAVDDVFLHRGGCSSVNDAL